MMNFKIQSFFTTLIIATVSTLTISDAISQKVNAQATPSCNNATITGSYGSEFTGTFTGTPIVQVGLIKFDGKGNFQGTDTLSSNGTIANRTLIGTYIVRQDCTVQIVWTDSNDNFKPVFKGIIVDDGKEIFLTQTNPGSVLLGIWKKVN